MLAGLDRDDQRPDGLFGHQPVGSAQRKRSAGCVTTPRGVVVDVTSEKGREEPLRHQGTHDRVPWPAHAPPSRRLFHHP
jgi:hypothetical protein